MFKRLIAVSLLAFALQATSACTSMPPAPEDVSDTDKLIILKNYYADVLHDYNTAELYYFRLIHIDSFYSILRLDRNATAIENATVIEGDRLMALASYHTHITKDYEKAIHYAKKIENGHPRSSHLLLSEIYKELEQTRTNQEALLTHLQFFQANYAAACANDELYARFHDMNCETPEANKFSMEIANLYMAEEGALYDLDKAEAILLRESEKGGFDIYFELMKFNVCQKSNPDQYIHWYKLAFPKETHKVEVPECKIFQ